jgi:RNA polymerase sigma factor (sigma-70 family)
MREIYGLAVRKAELYATRRGLADDARDIVADVLVGCLDSIVRAERPAAYFYTVFVRRILDVLSHRAVMRRAEAAIEAEENLRQRHAHELQPAEVSRMVAEAMEALEALTPRERDVLLAVANGMNREDIAARFGTSRDNVDQICSRARAALRARRRGEGGA